MTVNVLQKLEDIKLADTLLSQAVMDRTACRATMSL